MKIIDRYLIRNFLGPFFITFLFSLFIILMQFLWKYVDDLVGKGLEWYIILELLFYASATFVKTVGDGKVVIKAAIEDVNGAKWNLTYEGVDPGTAIDNAKAGVTATKRIVNGQMVIRANGQEFNAQGVEIR